MGPWAVGGWAVAVLMIWLGCRARLGAIEWVCVALLIAACWVVLNPL